MRLKALEAVVKRSLLDQVPCHGSEKSACRNMVLGQANVSSHRMLRDENAWPRLMNRQGRDFTFSGDWFWPVLKSWLPRCEIGTEGAGWHAPKRAPHLLVVNPSHEW